MSDGASESYDSRTWARMLVEKCIVDPTITSEWIGSVVAQYETSVDYEQLSWSKQASYDRGSFATLLAVEFALNGSEIEVLAIGDSVAIHVSGGEILASFPYTKQEEFDSRPTLLSTLSSANKFVGQTAEFAKNSITIWQVRPGDCLLLMTDAVGQWLLKENSNTPSALLQLLEVNETSAFEDMVWTLRKEHRMRLDDSTLIRLVVDEG